LQKKKSNYEYSPTVQQDQQDALFVFGLLRINSLYMFPALLAYHLEALDIQQLLYFVTASRYIYKGRGNSVGIATGYGLSGPGIESRWGRDFSPASRPALQPTQLPVQWVTGLSRG
jgi:hypothetical protein